MTADAPGPKDATPITRARNCAVLDALPFGDRQDFEDARRGFIGTLPEVEITNAQGRVVWSLKDYAFLAAEDAPPTVNPSLWRQARLNMENWFCASLTFADAVKTGGSCRGERGHRHRAVRSVRRLHAHVRGGGTATGPIAGPAQRRINARPDAGSCSGQRYAGDST